jgi:WD40 repeat protein
MSEGEVETKQRADFHTSKLLQELSICQQQLLVSAVQISVAEARLLDEKREALRKQVLNNPKVIQAVVTIQKAAIQNRSWEIDARELDSLTTTIIEQIAGAKACTEQPNVLKPLPWQNSLTSLEQTLCSIKNTHHLSRYEFAKLFTDSFRSRDGGSSVNPTLAPLFDLTIPTKHRFMRMCAVNNQSSLLATAGYEGLVSVRSLRNGKQLFIFMNDGDISSCAFAPDNSWLAVTTRKGGITLWSLQTGEKVAEIQHRCAIDRLFINPEGTKITTIDIENIMTRWDWRNNTAQIISFQQMPILALDSDQTHCAIYHNQETFIVRLEDQAIITSLRTGPLTSAHFGHDDSSLICLSTDKRQLVVWDLVSGEPTTFEEEDAPITCIALAKTAPWIVFGLENGKAWRLNYQGRGEYWPLNGSITAVAISADGSRAAAVSSEYEIAVTDSKQKNFLYAEKKQLTDSDCQDFLFTPDGQYLISTYETTGKQASLTIHMFAEQALELLRECSAGQIELIEDLASLTLIHPATQKPLLTRKEKVKLTAYQSALFHFLPDFIKQVLLRTDKILITPATEVTKIVAKP